MKINRAYWNITKHLNNIRYVVTFGGRRSGKSYAISQLLCLRALESKRTIVCARKVGRTLRLSLFPRVESALQEIGIKYVKNKTDMTLILPNGSKFLFIGMDDPEKLKSLEDATDFWFEEATEFTESDLDTADAGLSANVTPQPTVWLSFNPIPVIAGNQHWLQLRFLNGEFPLGEIKIKGNALVLRTCYKQNKFCPQHVIDVLEGYKTHNPDLYKMWGLGEFTTIKGAIITDWDIVDEVPEGIDPAYNGLDFGFSADPATLIRTWVHNDDVWAKEEIYQTGLTNQALGAKMRLLDNEYPLGVTIADSAEPKSIQELKDMGFYVKGFPKSPDYKRVACQWLQGKHIHILSGSTNMIKEIGGWTWDFDRQGNQMPKPKDGDDHTCDALIYATVKNMRKATIIRY